MHADSLWPIWLIITMKQVGTISYMNMFLFDHLQLFCLFYFTLHLSNCSFWSRMKFLTSGKYLVFKKSLLNRRVLKIILYSISKADYYSSLRGML